MKVDVRIEPKNKTVQIDRVDLINGLLDDVIPLQKQLKRQAVDRINWDDLDEAETLLEQLQALNKLYIALKTHKYALPTYYPEDFPEEGDKGLSSLFG